MDWMKENLGSSPLEYLNFISAAYSQVKLHTLINKNNYMELVSKVEQQFMRILLKLE